MSCFIYKYYFYMNDTEYQKTLLMLLILFALEDERPEMNNKK